MQRGRYLTKFVHNARYGGGQNFQGDIISVYTAFANDFFLPYYVRLALTKLLDTATFPFIKQTIVHTTLILEIISCVSIFWLLKNLGEKGPLHYARAQVNIKIVTERYGRSFNFRFPSNLSLEWFWITCSLNITLYVIYLYYIHILRLLYEAVKRETSGNWTLVQTHFVIFLKFIYPLFLHLLNCLHFPLSLSLLFCFCFVAF